jgi:hypothetical protein
MLSFLPLSSSVSAPVVELPSANLPTTTYANDDGHEHHRWPQTTHFENKCRLGAWYILFVVAFLFL